MVHFVNWCQDAQAGYSGQFRSFDKGLPSIRRLQRLLGTYGMDMLNDSVPPILSSPAGAYRRIRNTEDLSIQIPNLTRTSEAEH